MANHKSKLNIAMVLDDGLDKPDGVQQYILGIGSWLVSEGHNVDFLVGETKRTDIENVYSLSRNIRVNSNGNSMTIPLPTSGKKLKSFMKQKNYDIIHVQTPYSPFMGGRLISYSSNQSGVIGTFHILPNSLIIYIGNWLLGILCYFTLKRFDVMLSVSDVAASFARKTFHINSEVLPNVVEYNRFADATPLKRFDDGKLNILFLGRLVPRKGCRTLLKAISLLHQNHPETKNYRVIICGTGPEERSLKNYVEVTGLQNIVEFAGFVSELDKPRYYASADIAVFPSSGGESFGIVLLEALASARGVVLGGDNPGYRSVLGSRANLLFDANNADDLSEQIYLYLQNNEARQSMAHWGSNFAKQFDVSIVGTKLLAYYRQALQKRANQ